MCSQFRQHFDLQAYSMIHDIEFNSENDKATFVDNRILPYRPATVITLNAENNLAFQYMNFSLVPSWSKDPKVKFATHNARIETVLEKPTWKIPFLRQHCIVPISSFYESSYEGPLQGNILEFKAAGGKSKPLLAAGIFDIWNKTNYSFSILTTTPDKFIEHHGHDRSPIFLNESDAVEWNHLSGSDKELMRFITSQTLRPELEVNIDRPMKAGWEKRK